MKVKAAKRLSYGRKQYEPGDELDVSDKDAKLLAAVGRVSLTEPPKAPQEPARKPRQQPEPPQEAQTQTETDEGSSKARRGKRSGYKRRDMTAEDSSTQTEDE